MAFNKRETIVPLYINSIDRNDINEPTTNFTISLRKSLKFISSIEVSNVGIPKTYTNINKNNSLLIATFCDGVPPTCIEYPFEIQMPIRQYTPTDYKDELLVQLNDTELTAIFNLTWTVDFDTITNMFYLSVIYPFGGGVPEWGFNIIYTPMVDVLGIGPGDTSTQVLREGPGSDTLIFSIQRVTALYNNLHMNITSTALTGDINTSYIRSFGKMFNIEIDSKVSTGNDTIIINTTQTLDPYSNIVPSGLESDGIILQGTSVSLSGDGLIAAHGGPGDTGGLGATWVFSSIVTDGFYLQRIPKIVGTDFKEDSEQGTDIVISRNGNFMAVGGPNDEKVPLASPLVRYGAVWVFRRAGVEWIQQIKIENLDGSAGRSVALSNDGLTLAIGTPGYQRAVGFLQPGLGAVQIWTQTDGLWAQTELLDKTITPVPPPFLEAITDQTGRGGSVALSDATPITGEITLAINASIPNFGYTWVLSRDDAGIWTLEDTFDPGVGITFARDGQCLSISASGDTLAIGYTTFVNIHQRTLGTWTLEATIPKGGTVDLDAAGDTLAIGDITDSGGIGATFIYVRQSGPTWVLQSGALTAIDNIGVSNQGSSVSLSSDGNTLMVGGSQYDNQLGASWIYKRDSSTLAWSQYNDGLVGNDSSAASQQGYSVAISSDITTMVVGGPEDNQARGAVWVYTRDGINWIQQGPKIIAPIIDPAPRQGESVAISADGNYIVFGAPDDDTTRGRVHVYVRDESSIWSLQQVLNAPGATAGALQGFSVSISADGKTIAYGAPDNNTGQGAVWVWNRIDTVWTENTSSPLVGTAGSGDNLGWSVSLSGDGTTIATGGPGDNGGLGATWVFVNSGTGVWVSQGAKLVGVPNDGSSSQGISVSLSADGNTLVVGGPLDGNNGGAWVFTRSTGVWSQEAGKLVGIDFSLYGELNQGQSVSVSDDGNMFAMGGPGAGKKNISLFQISKGTGGTWVFERTGTTWTQLGSKLVKNSVYPDVRQGESVSLKSTGPGEYYVSAGGPLDFNEVGVVFQFFNKITLDIQYIVQVPSRAYSIFDLVNELNQLLQFETVSFNVEFDISTETITYTAVPVPGVTVVFSVDTTSTFNEVIPFTPLTGAATDSQQSSVIDFTINNNVIKSVNTHINEVRSLVIYDTDPTLQYRKYRSGYSIEETDIVDIQLRDERDRIIDLGGANWIMTVFATIRN